jgi:hypothetical protein
MLASCASFNCPENPHAIVQLETSILAHLKL